MVSFILILWGVIGILVAGYLIEATTFLTGGEGIKKTVGQTIICGPFVWFAGLIFIAIILTSCIVRKIDKIKRNRECPD